MEINTVREIALLLALAAFACIVFWAYGPARRKRFERDALSIFDDDERDAATRAQLTPGRKGA